MIKEMFTFLDDLRLSGKINMWGAPKVLEEAFDLSPEEAKQVFIRWKEQF